MDNGPFQEDGTSNVFNLVSTSASGSAKAIAVLRDIISILPISSDSFYYIDNTYTLRDKYGNEFIHPCMYGMMLTSNILVYTEDETTLHVRKINKGEDTVYSFDDPIIHISGRYPDIWIQTTTSAFVINSAGEIQSNSFPSNIRRVFYTDKHYADYMVDESSVVEYYENEEVSRSVNVKAFYFDNSKLHVMTEPNILYADRYMKVYKNLNNLPESYGNSKSASKIEIRNSNYSKTK